MRARTGISALATTGLYLFSLVPGQVCPRFAAADDHKNHTENVVDFVRDIEPILREHCHKCHGPNRQRGELRLDEKSAAMKGGESFAPAIIPGQAGISPLFRFIDGQVDGMQMPPEGETKLSTSEIELIRAWIDQGAEWPDPEKPKLEEKQHWSFLPLVKPQLPAVSLENSRWARNPTDLFIAAKLEELEKQNQSALQSTLRPSAESERRTLIRRASFDSIGLPPTPEEVDDFLAQTRPDAFDRLIDRLLASPHFGERWARHWLDVVRFAESDGFETNQPRPNAWPYRDYVIRAFNEDKPFDQFVFEQLAGDTIGIDEATGFLVGGAVDKVKSPDPVLTAQQRADELHDMVSTTSSAFFGLTVGCARCHNHKFDPISQTDYYSLKAVFAGVQHGERSLKPLDFERREKLAGEIRKELEDLEQKLAQFEPLAFVATHEQQTTPARYRSPVRRRTNVDRFSPVKTRFIKFVIQATTGGEPCIDELEVLSTSFDADARPKNVAHSSCGTKVTSSSNLPGYEIHQLKFVNDGRYGNSASWISNELGRGWVQLEFPEPVEIDRVLWSRDRPENGHYQDRIATRYHIEAGLNADQLQTVATSDDRFPFDSNSTSAESINGLDETQQKLVTQLSTERDSLRERLRTLTNYPVIYAGRFVKPETTHRFHRGDPTQPKELVAPAALASFGKVWQLADDSAERDRRRALADWICGTDHPLMARVMVNRLWHFHFRQGIVTTPSDFGRNGALPSHPELLDWLASETRRNDSPKRLHRMLMLSSTWRQSSSARADAMRIDGGTKYLWRFPPRRLEAEPIRDSILAVCGNLDDRMYGVGFDLFEPNKNYVKVYNSKHNLGPAEWRRMIYQSKPRMQLDEIFGQFDCPDAGQITPKRTSSITALQALNLLNSQFVMQQSEIFANRLQNEATDDPGTQAQRAFLLAFQREPSDVEVAEAAELIRANGLPALCRALLNANEFLFVF